MADKNSTTAALPDWWEREKQRRLLRVLILLGLLLALIGYFYYEFRLGRGVQLIGTLPQDTSNHIAFIRRETSKDSNLAAKVTLYSVRADGTDLTPLTPPNDASEKSTPAWTADGHNVVYASNKLDVRKTQLYLLGAKGSAQLTYGPERKEFPTASPDGHHVAFITQGAIKSVLLNGNDVIQLLPAPRAGNESSGDNPTPDQADPSGPYLSAAYSSDGASIAGVQELDAFNSTIAGLTEGDQLVRAYPLGASRAAVVSAGRFVSMAWEPAGNRLLTAFAERPIDVNFQTKFEKQSAKPKKKEDIVSGVSLWSFDKPDNPKESPQLLFDGPDLLPENIVWSPDSKKIAFEAWALKPDGERVCRGIMVMPLPDRPILLHSAQIAKLPVSIPIMPDGTPSNPRFSPDGSRILFQVTHPNQQNDLFIVNSDLTNPVNLTKGIGDNTQGVWSPALPK